MSLVTRLAAPTTAPWPMPTPSRIITRDPIQASSSITIGGGLGGAGAKRSETSVFDRS